MPAPEPLSVPRGPVIGYRKGSQLISYSYLSTGWVRTVERIMWNGSMHTPHRLKEQAAEWALARESPAQLPPSQDRLSVMWMSPATSNLSEREAAPWRFRIGLEEILSTWNSSLADSSEETDVLHAVTPSGWVIVPSTGRNGSRHFDPKAPWIDELAKELEPIVPVPEVELDF
jgi:hypothetical protein